MVSAQQDPAPPDDGLSDQQRAFCDAYVVHPKGARAAREAGYSPHSAAEQAYDLLRKPQIRAYIDKRLAERGFTAERVLRELEICGASDISDYVIDDYGHVSLSEDANPDAMRAVRTIKRVCKTDEDGNLTVTTEIGLWDKPGSLQLLGKRHKLFTDTVELDASSRLAALIAKAAEPPKEGA